MKKQGNQDLSDKTAIILGASGLTGGILLDLLLKDKRYSRVKVFGRKPISLQHPKLEVHVGDLLTLEKFKDDFKGDEVFCCIGTTAKKTPDQMEYKKIDYGIPVTAAKLCIANEIPCLVIISSLGADKNSRIFYSRTKGEMEWDVLALAIPQTFILEPSIIKGPRNEKRLGESIGIVVSQIIKPLLFGPFKKYRLIEADTIAKAMVKVANFGFEKKIITSEEIQILGESN